MEKVTIYLKSGQTAVFYARSIHATNHRDGSSSFKWYNAEDVSLPTLEYVSTEDTVLIITEYIDEFSTKTEDIK